MNVNTVTGDIIDLKLRQLGATNIRVFNSKMHIINFDLGDGLIVSYVFNITRNDKFFLQRMRPYAMVEGKYVDQKSIVEFIEDDITRFRASKHINNAKLFVKTADKFGDIFARMEHIFLHHKVDEKVLNDVYEAIEAMGEKLEKIHRSSEIIKLHDDED